jgi:hypothetical protein
VTPWKSHLGSEEEEPDARVLSDLAASAPDGMEWMADDIAAYVTSYLDPESFPAPAENLTNADVLGIYNYYLYGYPWEVRAAARGRGAAQRMRAASAWHGHARMRYRWSCCHDGAALPAFRFMQVR